LRTPEDSRAHDMVLFDYILDRRLPCGVLRTAILLGYELV
jgi:hypothetical protein